ncbi:unnamed protein product [Prunus armeniaca]
MSNVRHIYHICISPYVTIYLIEAEPTKWAPPLWFESVFPLSTSKRRVSVIPFLSVFNHTSFCRANGLEVTGNGGSTEAQGGAAAPPFAGKSFEVAGVCPSALPWRCPPPVRINASATQQPPFLCCDAALGAALFCFLIPGQTKSFWPSPKKKKIKSKPEALFPLNGRVCSWGPKDQGIPALNDFSKALHALECLAADPSLSSKKIPGSAAGYRSMNSTPTQRAAPNG